MRAALFSVCALGQLSAVLGAAVAKRNNPTVYSTSSSNTCFTVQGVLPPLLPVLTFQLLPQTLHAFPVITMSTSTAVVTSTPPAKTQTSTATVSTTSTLTLPLVSGILTVTSTVSSVVQVVITPAPVLTTVFSTLTSLTTSTSTVSAPAGFFGVQQVTHQLKRDVEEVEIEQVQAIEARSSDLEPRADEELEGRGLFTNILGLKLYPLLVNCKNHLHLHAKLISQASRSRQSQPQSSKCSPAQP